MSQESNLPVPVPSQVPARRQEASWLTDETAAYIEYREPAAAGALAFFTGGGGHLYNRKFAVGLGLTIASAACFVGAGAFSAPILIAAWAALGATSAVKSVIDARTINRLVLARDAEMRRGDQNNGGTYRLLSAMHGSPPHQAQNNPAVAALLAQPPPRTVSAAGPHQSTIDRLRQLKTLVNKKMLNDTEYQDRKIDVLSQYSSIGHEEVDSLLFALIPLVEESTLSSDDIEFVKTLNG